jgi:iron complex transport system substrate-binding protein
VVESCQVFNNDAQSNPAGGNDNWESGTVRPDLILADLIGVFHPDLLRDHQLVYYRQLK